MFRFPAFLCTVASLLVLAAPTMAAESESFGDALGLESATPIATILADPAAWAGKTVRVEGTISDVCPRKGCWMTLTEEDATIRVKVEDDVIVFPRESTGKTAAAEGVVRVRELERDSWISWQKHLAEEKGEDFDESSVGEGPFLSVQIEGHGAEIG